jgi:hypothetical protein
MMGLRALVSLALIFSLEAADCHVEDEVSLLQVASQLNPVELVSAQSSALAYELEMALRPERPQKEYHCLMHYKAGTDFCKQAASFVTNQSRDMGRMLPEIYEDEGATEFAVKDEQMKAPRKSCMMHIVRNPFDLAVSSYLYSKADLSREYYFNKPFGQAVEDDLKGCTPGFIAGRMSDWCEDRPEKYPMVLFHRAMAKIYMNSSTGYLTKILPTAKPEEIYSDYLRRVPPEAGLLASSIFVTEASYEPMKFAKDYISNSNQWCSTNVCFSELYDDCHGMWDKVLKAWQIDEPDFTPMLNATTKACPKESIWAKLHASTHVAKEKKLDHPPLHELVQLLRKVDKEHLNGQLAQLESDLGCGSSSNYRPPSKEPNPILLGH